MAASVLYVPGERARPDWVRRRSWAWVAAVATVCFGAFMGQLDASVVALTYHSIGHSFGAPLSSVQWVTLTYLIALGVLLVPVGRLSDRIGRKRVYLWGFAVFTAASAACALAGSLAELAGLRAVQGIGAAMLQANSVAIVATAAPRSRLRAALGMQAAAQAVGLAIGPTVGGLLVQTVGWRWVFAINVPVGVVAVVSGRYLLPRTRRRRPTQQAGRLRDLLRTPTVVRSLAGALLAYLLLFGPIVLVPNLLQRGGSSALLAGLVVAALPAGFAVGAVAAERVVPAGWSASRRCRAGIAVAIAGLGALLAGGTALPWCVLALLALGLGLGMFTPTNNSLIMAAVPDSVAALAGGLVSATRAAGTAAGTLLVASTLGYASGRVTVALLLGLAAAATFTIVRSARPAR